MKNESSLRNVSITFAALAGVALMAACTGDIEATSTGETQDHLGPSVGQCGPLAPLGVSAEPPGLVPANVGRTAAPCTAGSANPTMWHVVILNHALRSEDYWFRSNGQSRHYVSGNDEFYAPDASVAVVHNPLNTKTRIAEYVDTPHSTLYYVEVDVVDANPLPEPIDSVCGNCAPCGNDDWCRIVCDTNGNYDHMQSDASCLPHTCHYFPQMCEGQPKD